jgi:hypothetical protein
VRACPPPLSNGPICPCSCRSVPEQKAKKLPRESDALWSREAACAPSHAKICPEQAGLPSWKAEGGSPSKLGRTRKPLPPRKTHGSRRQISKKCTSLLCCPSPKGRPCLSAPQKKDGPRSFGGRDPCRGGPLPAAIGRPRARRLLPIGSICRQEFSAAIRRITANMIARLSKRGGGGTGAHADSIRAAE